MPEVYLSPVFDEVANMTDFFESSGFGDFAHFRIYDDFCIIDYASYDRAKAFVNEFDGVRIRSCKVSCYIVGDRGARREDREPDDRSRPRGRSLRSKTIVVRNYPQSYLSDRNIWNDFRDSGFIREIEVRGFNAYIQFDTENDAYHALDEMDGRRINAGRIRVEMVQDRQLNQPNLHLPLELEMGDAAKSAIPAE
jgi:hypothetical protein